MKDEYIQNGVIEFSKIGIQFLFLTNGSAIIAIIAHLSSFLYENKDAVIFVTLVYALGLMLAFFTTFSAYKCHFNLAHKKNLVNGEEIFWFRISIFCSIFSFMCFVFSSIIGICFLIN